MRNLVLGLLIGLFAGVIIGLMMNRPTSNQTSQKESQIGGIKKNNKVFDCDMVNTIDYDNFTKDGVNVIN